VKEGLDKTRKQACRPGLPPAGDSRHQWNHISTRWARLFLLSDPFYFLTCRVAKAFLATRAVPKFFREVSPRGLFKTLARCPNVGSTAFSRAYPGVAGLPARDRYVDLFFTLFMFVEISSRSALSKCLNNNA